MTMMIARHRYVVRPNQGKLKSHLVHSCSPGPGDQGLIIRSSGFFPIFVTLERMAYWLWSFWSLALASDNHWCTFERLNQNGTFTTIAISSLPSQTLFIESLYHCLYCLYCLYRQLLVFEEIWLQLPEDRYCEENIWNICIFGCTAVCPCYNNDNNCCIFVSLMHIYISTIFGKSNFNICHCRARLGRDWWSEKESKDHATSSKWLELRFYFCQLPIDNSHCIIWLQLGSFGI